MGTNFSDLMASLKAITVKYDLPLIVVHPSANEKKRMESLEVGKLDQRHSFSPSRSGFFDYVKLQMHARCVIFRTSGTITEESFHFEVFLAVDHTPGPRKARKGDG